jgi:DNA adenine methylase
VVKPIVSWPGGKRRLAPKLLPLFPNHTCYVEPFAGGAGLFFLRPEPAKVEVLNDINGELVNLYRVVQHHLDEFVRQFRWALYSRQSFLWAKSQRPETLTDIQRAARFFYVQKAAFGAKVVGQTFGAGPSAPRLNLTRLEEDLSAAHLRLAGAVIEHLPWQDCIARYDRAGTFFFLDPPYWQVEGYGVEFDLSQYQSLASTMRTLKGKALLTVNDHPDVRAAFAGLRSVRVTTRYTIGTSAASRAAVRGELVFRNW